MPAVARPVLKEQIAFPGQPAQPDRSANADYPAWLNRRENSASPISPAPLRELRIKVWETPDASGAANRGSLSNEQAAPAFPPPGAGEQYEADMEDLPTSQLGVAPGSAPASDRPIFGPSRREAEASLPADSPYEPHRRPAIQRDSNAYSAEVEQLETHPMQSQRAVSPTSLPPAAPYPGQRPWHAQTPLPLPSRQPWQIPGSENAAFGQQYRPAPAAPVPPLSSASAASPGLVQHPVMQRPVTPSMPVSMPGVQPAQTALSGSRPRKPVRSHGKTRLVVVMALLLLLLIGGVVAWLVVSSPFTVPAVTKTTVSFQNASLGVSLQYPQGWMTQLDSQHGAASFFDPNHTDQFNLNTISKSGLSVDQYIKNTTGQLGMTGQKNLSPLAFAGQSWQQVRGTVLVSGATYTATLLVTTHAGRMYALLLMAPAQTYSNADLLFFAPMRSSFQFS